MIKLTISREQSRQRLDRVLAESLPAFSRARLQTLIRDGFVLLNGKLPRPRDLVRTGDNVETDGKMAVLLLHQYLALLDTPSPITR